MLTILLCDFEKSIFLASILLTNRVLQLISQFLVLLVTQILLFTEFLLLAYQTFQFTDLFSHLVLIDFELGRFQHQLSLVAPVFKWNESIVLFSDCGLHFMQLHPQF
jgi:hypothetical protein